MLELSGSQILGKAMFVLQYFVVEYGMYNDDPPSASNKTRGSASSPGITKGAQRPIENLMSYDYLYSREIMARILQGCTRLTSELDFG